MFSKKVLWTGSVLVFAVLNSVIYAVPRDYGPGPGGPGFGGRGPGHDHDSFIRVVIAPPRIRPLIIYPPHRRVIMESSVIVVAPPVVVVPSRTVVVPETTVVASPTVGETVVIWITNDNGSKTPVTLVRQKDYYVGPKGEYYLVLPTDEQLRPLYGLPSTSTKQADITVWITNDNGSRTPITLTPSSGGFIGPSGEVYAAMPSEQQLKAVYGLPSQSAQTDSTVVWISDSAGKKVPIVLVKEGSDFVGPSGEHYSAIPGKEQLEAVYGKTSAAANANSVTVWVESGNSKIPVTLQKQGNVYVGPNGEQYASLPTAEQLKLVYAPAAGVDEQGELGFLITKNDGKQVVIPLKRKGTEFIGPNGETYAAMPTEEQLKATYGK